MANSDLDCRGMNCPMPIVRLSQALKSIAIGDTITVSADDPSFQADLEAWVRMTGQTLRTLSTAGATRTAVIERSR